MSRQVSALSRRHLLTTTATLSIAGCSSVLSNRDTDGENPESLGRWPAYQSDQQNTNFRPGSFDPPIYLHELLTFETTLQSPSGVGVGTQTVFLAFDRTLYAVSIADGSIR